MTEKRKLCRSMSDKAIFGVCSGFAKYFDIDPIVIRLAVVLLALMGTLGLWFYILAAIIMPKDTDFVYAQQPRYDTETGRPLYEAGGTIYENRANGFGAQGAPVQDVEFTSTAYSSAETVRTSESVESAEVTGDAAAADASEFAENTASESASETFGDTGPASDGDTSGSWTEPAQSTASQSADEQPRQDPYKNFQDYQTGTQQNQQFQQSQQSQKTYQAYQPQSQAQHETRGNRRSRNTGILFIIIGVVILAKIVLPRINIWIPISIASIFFGIYLCCRKK